MVAVDMGLHHRLALLKARGFPAQDDLGLPNRRCLLRGSRRTTSYVRSTIASRACRNPPLMQLTLTLTVRAPTVTAHGPPRLSLFLHSTVLLHSMSRKTRKPAGYLHSAVTLRRSCAIGLRTLPSPITIPVPGSVTLMPCIRRRLGMPSRVQRQVNLTIPSFNQMCPTGRRWTASRRSGTGASTQRPCMATRIPSGRRTGRMQGSSVFHRFDGSHSISSPSDTSD